MKFLLFLENFELRSFFILFLGISSVLTMFPKITSNFYFWFGWLDQPLRWDLFPVTWGSGKNDSLAQLRTKIKVRFYQSGIQFLLYLFQVFYLYLVDFITIFQKLNLQAFWWTDFVVFFWLSFARSFFELPNLQYDSFFIASWNAWIVMYKIMIGAKREQRAMLQEYMQPGTMLSLMRISVMLRFVKISPLFGPFFGFHF